MISVIFQNTQNGAVLLRGLSTDTKPTGVVDVDTGEITLANGSVYECINTGERFLYDSENEHWYQVTDAVITLGVTSFNGATGSVSASLTASGDGIVTLDLTEKGDDING